MLGEDGRTLNRGRTHQSFLLDAAVAGVVVDKEREKRSDRHFKVGEGETLGVRAGPVEEVTLGRCQAFSGPHGNYHNDVEAAGKLGFPDIVVQGMMPLCFISEMMTKRFGEGWFAGGRMNVNLVNVLWRGDSVRCGDLSARGLRRLAGPSTASGLVRERRRNESRRRKRQRHHPGYGRAVREGVDTRGSL